MAWKIEQQKRALKVWPLWRRWEYEVILSSHGMVWGSALTKRAAARKLERAQGRMLAE